MDVAFAYFSIATPAASSVMVTTKWSSLLPFQNPMNKLAFDMNNNNNPIRNMFFYQ
jgi:hypothetical protein